MVQKWTLIHWSIEIILATNHIFRLLRSSAVTSANYFYPHVCAYAYTHRKLSLHEDDNLHDMKESVSGHKRMI